MNIRILTEKYDLYNISSFKDLSEKQLKKAINKLNSEIKQKHIVSSGNINWAIIQSIAFIILLALSYFDKNFGAMEKLFFLYLFGSYTISTLIMWPIKPIIHDQVQEKFIHKFNRHVQNLIETSNLSPNNERHS